MESFRLFYLYCVHILNRSVMSKKVKYLQLVNVNYLDIPNNYTLTHLLTHVIHS